MIAQRGDLEPRPSWMDEPFPGYRFVRGCLIALTIEILIAGAVAGWYFGCHQVPS